MKQFTQEGRITSRHGYLLPPKKKPVVKRYVTIQFIIPGTIPSKKNMLWADSNINKLVGKLTMCKTVAETTKCIQEDFKAYIKNSKRYIEWMAEIRPEIDRQLQIEASRHKYANLVFPLSNASIKIYHYWKDNIERDLDNKQSTIFDLFKTCCVIANDNWQCLGTIHSDCEEYSGQILQALTTVDVTYKVYA